MATHESLSVVDAGSSRSLLINRANGKWIITSSADAQLALDAHADPGDTRTSAVNSALQKHGLFDPPYRPPERLNTLIIKVTKRCNFSCTYCYDLEPGDQMTDLPIESAQSAVAEALDMCRSSNPAQHPDLGLILHGGEPTLRWRFVEELVVWAGEQARIRGKTISFTIQSNLSSLNDRVVEFSEQHNITWGTSIDGLPATNDRFRVLGNGHGTYHFLENVAANYPNFLRRLGVLSTITSSNDSQLLDMARHFRDLGVPSWKLSHFQPIGMGRHAKETIDYDPDRFIASWDSLLAAVEFGEFDGFDVGPITEYLFNFITGPGHNMCRRNGCGAARDLLSVSSDGTIESCDCIDRKGPLANLGLMQIHTRDSLAKALASDRAVELRSRNVATQGCGSCSWLALCGGTCMAHANTVNGKDDKLCAIAMNAYSKIARSIATGPQLRRYKDSLRPSRAKVSHAL